MLFFYILLLSYDFCVSKNVFCFISCDKFPRAYFFCVFILFWNQIVNIFIRKTIYRRKKRTIILEKKKSFSISSVHIHFVFCCEFILFIGFFHQIYFLRYLVWFYYWILWDNLIWQKNKSFARIAIVGWLVSQLITFTWLKILQWKGNE